MDKDPIPTAGKVKRYVFVGSFIVDPLGVLIFQLEGLAGQIHLGKTFPGAGKTFIMSSLEGHGHFGTLSG